MPEHVTATLGESLLSGGTQEHVPAGSGSSDPQEAGLHEWGRCARDWSEQRGCLILILSKSSFFFFVLFISYFAFKCLS